MKDSEIIPDLRLRIAANLQIDADRIRWIRGEFPGQFGESGNWRWELFYRDQWRELPWHYDGPLLVTREMVRAWYG